MSYKFNLLSSKSIKEIQLYYNRESIRKFRELKINIGYNEARDIMSYEDYYIWQQAETRACELKNIEYSLMPLIKSKF